VSGEMAQQKRRIDLVVKKRNLYTPGTPLSTL